MSTWNELVGEMQTLDPSAQGPWLISGMTKALQDISTLRSDRNVLLYGSSFLEKPNLPGYAISITAEDLNGLMSALHGMDWSKGLTLILHTPGGDTRATESMVAYLRSKFDFIEAVVPTYAMSAGTMISLACDDVWMARHSQLGPIDPQLVLAGGQVSARAVVDQFARAENEIRQDLSTAHAWAPILSSIGPSLLMEAQNALDYSERMVSEWLRDWMLKESPDSTAEGREIAKFFNDAGFHKNHGRRIGRDEAREHGVSIHNIEEEGGQDLQEAILTAYHLMTLIFQTTPTGKLIMTSAGASWIKNVVLQSG